MQMLSSCELKYYYNYYKANNKDGNEDSKKASRLKLLKTIDLLSGEIFHSQVKNLIKSSNVRETGAGIFGKILTNKIDRAFYESQTKSKEWMVNPRKYTMLNEVYYHQDDLAEKKKENSIKKLTGCSKNIFNSLRFRELAGEEDKVKILELDSLKEFYLTIKAYVKLDALYVDKDGVYNIVDWKTSNKCNWCEGDVIQLLVYSLYVHLVYGVEPEMIKANVVYVATKKTYTYTFTIEDLEFIKEKIMAEMEILKSFTVDFEKNQPLSESSFRTGNTHVCRTCNFKEICG